MDEKTLVLTIVYINIVLYATCYQIQRPLEPYLIDSLLKTGDSADEYAKLQSFFSIMQTFGSTFTGYFLDKLGAKRGFMISFLASALSYFLLSQSSSIYILYLSKIPAIFQSGFLCGQLAVAQITTDGPERLRVLGRLTTCYTIGSIIGPAIGGWLGASKDYFFGAKLAVIGSLLSLGLTFFIPTASITAPHKDKVTESGKLTVSSPEKNISVMKVFLAVWLLLSTKVITSIAISIGSSAMPLIFKNIYKLNEQSLGFVMSSMSAFNAVVNGLFLGPITVLVGGSLLTIIEICIFIMAGLLALQSILALPYIASNSYENGLFEYMIILFILNIFQFVLATTITGESTSRVSQNSKGTLLGLEHGLFAAARILTSFVATTLLKSGGITGVSGTCSAVFIGVCIMWKTFRSSLNITNNNNISSSTSSTLIFDKSLNSTSNEIERNEERKDK